MARIELRFATKIAATLQDKFGVRLGLDRDLRDAYRAVVDEEQARLGRIMLGIEPDPVPGDHVCYCGECGREFDAAQDDRA